MATRRRHSFVSKQRNVAVALVSSTGFGKLNISSFCKGFHYLLKLSFRIDPFNNDKFHTLLKINRVNVTWCSIFQSRTSSLVIMAAL